MTTKPMTKAERAVALLEAVNRGNLAVAKKLVAQGADPNKRVDGWIGPPIEIAVNAGHEAMARWLLGLDVKLPRTLLQTAAYANSLWAPKLAWLIRQLIEDGANVNHADDSGLTAMFMLRDPELIELALAHGGRLDVKAKDGSTPLHWAARAAPDAIVELLLDRGADIAAKDRAGKTALGYAKALGKYGKTTVALLSARMGKKPPAPKTRSWKQVEDDLLARTTKAIAKFAKQHRSETFVRFAFDCNSAYAEVLPSLLAADGELGWSIGDWTYQAFATFELDVEGIADAEEREPFMAMACAALIRLEAAKAFAPLVRSPKLEVLALDHDEVVSTAQRRLRKLRA